MTNKQLIFSLQNKELKLDFWEYLTHFGVTFYLLIIPIIILFSLIKDILTGYSRPLKVGELYFIFIPTILSLFLFWTQRKKLKFKNVETNLNRKEIAKIIDNISTELKWTIFNNNDRFFIAKTFPSLLSGSWGEQITIIFDNSTILVNSICDPHQHSSITSFGRNKRNVNRLIEEIKNASHQHSIANMVADESN